MSVKHWDEIRTAYHVAQAGTVSGAAAALGVHHSTVIRHVDALEARLGTRLFQRHPRGYTPTEAGSDLLTVAAATDDQLTQLVGRLRGRGDEVSGELVLTTIPGIADLLMPVLSRFQAAHPAVRLRYLTDARLFRLEYGEAHVAIRAGAQPLEPDNVAQPFYRFEFGLYAAPAYARVHGLPAGPDDFAGHRFVGAAGPGGGSPGARWLEARVPPQGFAFRSSETRAQDRAIRAGIGLGFIPEIFRPADNGLIPVMPPDPDWAAPLWLVTHVDLHRTAKVQTLLSFLKAEAKAWRGGQEAATA